MTYYQKTTDDLIRLFKRYADITGRGITSVSREVARDSTFYPSLEAGTNYSLKKADVVAANLAVLWPAGVPWPKGIPRPDLSLATIQPEEKEASNG